MTGVLLLIVRQGFDDFVVEEEASKVGFEFGDDGALLFTFSEDGLRCSQISGDGEERQEADALSAEGETAGGRSKRG